MNSEQHKEHIINVIENIKQQNIIIEKKLQELSIFYIINKDKYDYELVKTYFNNLKKFIISNDMPPITHVSNMNKFINYFNDRSQPDDIFANSPLYNYIEHSEYIVNKHKHIGFEHQIETWIKVANNSFNFICNEGEDKLIHLMLMNDKKLKCYENLMKLYPEPKPNCEKPEIKNIMDMYPENPEIVNLIDLFSGV
jgi:hypothetical protein